MAGQLDMTTWGVALNGDDGSAIEDTLGRQSPKVSVAISAEWIKGQRLARLSVERTCYTDDLEPWRQYWDGFLGALRRAGYRVN